MTNEQKRFKILKKKSYENQISIEEKKATKQTFMLGLSAAAIIAGLIISTDVSRYGIERIIGLGISMIGTFGAVDYLKELIESICRKINLQSKVEDIDNEIEMLENEKSRGTRIW